MNFQNLNYEQFDLFFKNTLKLSEAIQQVGGSPAVVLRNQAEFILTLSRNGVEINTSVHKGIAK